MRRIALGELPVKSLWNWFTTLLRGRPHFIVGDPADPYLQRWYLTPWSIWRGNDNEPLVPFVNLYLHRFGRSDDDRAPHDHPWWFLSLVLSGSYREWRQIERGSETVLEPKLRRAGSIACRKATDAHRVELIDNRPCWTLILTGPRVRDWGFHCTKGWVHWKTFTGHGEPGARSRGCGAA